MRHLLFVLPFLLIGCSSGAVPRVEQERLLENGDPVIVIKIGTTQSTLSLRMAQSFADDIIAAVKEAESDE